MSLEQFLRLAVEPQRGVRKGQHFANTLTRHRYNLFEKLQAEGLDPYYVDDLPWAVIEFVKNNWEEGN